MNLPLPNAVQTALARLDEAGYEAWLVGGVRDLCLKRTPHDYDITTAATPEEICRVFSDCSLNRMGERFGTVCVRLQNVPIDITTFRKETAYTDHRHPASVQFTKNLFEDLKRRDFTVNAMVYHPDKGLKDFFCGKRDLKKRIIRAIGDADLRFEEDALRILRALRFASVLNFTIEEKTRDAMFRKKHLLRNIAPERVTSELTRMLCGKNVRYVLTEFSEILGVIIPEILPAIGFSQHSPFHQYDVWMHTVHAVGYADPDPILRLTLLFHDISKPGCLTMDDTGRGHFYAHPRKSAVIAKEVMERLRFPARETELVNLLVTHHDSHPSGEREVKLLLGAVGGENFRLLLRVMRADILAHNKWTAKKRLVLWDRLKKQGEAILASGECYSLKTLNLKGSDLERAGVKGKRIGELLRLALQKVISGEWDNKTDFILRELEKNNW